MTNHTPFPPVQPVLAGIMLDFPAAMRAVIAGDRITKSEWNDAEYFAQLRAGLLMLHKPDGWFAWTVSEADMMGQDWLVLK